MLPSEFFERTNVNLTGNEYANVEEVYNAVKMDKDDFCKWWLKNRNNKLYQELADAYIKEVGRHLAELKAMERTNKELREEFDEYKAKKAVDIEFITETHAKAHREFAKKLILAQSEDYKGYDVIEEEFGIGFIIKTKREAGIPLSDAEIDYMVSKL